jgi:hypothetical protein
LAHDRNYKFSGKLPPEIERNLFLYAGLRMGWLMGLETTTTGITIL